MNDFIDQLNTKQTELDELKALLVLYPSLKYHQGRWQSYLCASEINTLAKDVQFIHSCGCCADSALYAMPHIKHNHRIIYSDPPQFYIGNKIEWGVGYNSNDHWPEDMRKHNIDHVIIDAVEKYLSDTSKLDHE